MTDRDRWVREVVAILAALKFCPCPTCRAAHRTCRASRRRLARLLARMQQAPR